MHPFELRGGRAACRELGADPILHGFDVVLGARFDLLDGKNVGRLWDPRATFCTHCRAAAGKPAIWAAAGPRASANNHAHSTRTRSRISPASLNSSRTAASLAAYRPSSGESASVAWSVAAMGLSDAVAK